MSTIHEAIEEVRKAWADLVAELRLSWIGQKLEKISGMIPLGGWYILLAALWIIVALPVPDDHPSKLIFNATGVYLAGMGLYRLFARK